MNSSQEAKLNMYHAVISHSDANPLITATVPAFDAMMAALKIKVDSIDSTVQQEALVISGVAADKKFLREILAQQAYKLAAAVFAYASSINNHTLKEEVDFSTTELLRHKDDELAPTCRNIHDAANANLAALAGYGITAPVLASFDGLIDQYAAVVPAPRNAAALRKTYAETLKTLFKDADNMLKNMLDKVAVQFIAGNLEFYNTYKNNRIIIDATTSHTQASGTVVSDIESEPIGGVAITIDGKPYVATTDADGNYSLKIPVPGTYNLTFTHAGFATKTINDVVVQLGKSTPLDVTMNILPS